MFPSDVAFTPAVKAIQEQKGSRSSYARMERAGGWETTVTPEVVESLHKRIAELEAEVERLRTHTPTDHKHQSGVPS